MGGNRDFPGGTAVKNSPVMQEMQVPFLGQEDTLEEEMATTPVFLLGKISWTGKPGGLQSIEWQSLTQQSTGRIKRINQGCGVR